jgi:hypothetical protein
MLISALLVLVSVMAGQAQTAEVVAKLIRATERLQLRTAQVDSIVQTITASRTHRHLPTAKAVYDFRLLDTTHTTDRLTGLGTEASPLDIAQQGATTGQVLRWSGAAWVPNGINLYDVVTTSQTVSTEVNQVWIDTLTVGITLNLPPCNAANDGVRFEFIKMGPDAYGVDIEPSGSEEFSDTQPTKTIFSPNMTFACTCRYTGGVGRWMYNSM